VKNDTRSGSAILWATTSGSGSGGKAIAFDALTLAELWSTNTPSFSKFTPPTVARGRLFVPSARTGVASAVLVYAPD
jgi:outer membrane protein assembly factor BamB